MFNSSRAIVCLFAKITLALLAEHPAIAQDWKHIPLTTAGNTIGMEVVASSDGQRFAYQRDGRTIPLPDGFVPQSLLRSRNGQLVSIGRETIRGTLRAVTITEPTLVVTSLTIRQELADKLYFLHAFSTSNAQYLVAYDIEETVPSGRSAQVVKDGVDIYQLKVLDDSLELQRIADKLSIGNLDTAFFDAPHENGHALCAQSSCIIIAKAPETPAITEVHNDIWKKRTLIELGRHGDELRGLFRADYDDRFTPPPTAETGLYLDCVIAPDGTCTSLPIDKLPSGYDSNGKITYVQECAGIAEILMRDLARLPASGLTYFAMNNYEGRIPWGQVYVLDGYIDVAEKIALQGQIFDGVREAMKSRLSTELLWWARLNQTEQPWLWTKRYSLDRANIISVVHIGRMARVVARARNSDLFDRQLADGLLKDFRHALVDLNRVVEQFEFSSTGLPNLAIRKGVPFWLDGSNVPWNYQSGWIEGIAALKSSGQIESASADDSHTSNLVEKLVKAFISTEIEPARPQSWYYCDGRCQAGWTAADDVSVNTKDWIGNKTRTDTAHISYRTMDARAVLDSMSVFKISGLEWFPAYSAELTKQGHLYPMLGAPLSAFGIKVNFPAPIVGTYGRSATPSEVHNQIWALDSLARSFPGCGK